MDNAKNFAKVTVSTGYDGSATSIVLTTGHGAKLPTVPFNAVWWNSTDYADPADDPNVEIVRVTARSTDTLTVTRGQEGTSASTKNTASKTYKMIAGLTAKVINTELALPAVLFNQSRVSGNGPRSYYSDDVDVHFAVTGTKLISVSYPGKKNQTRDPVSDWADADDVYAGVKLGSYLYVLLRDTATTPDTWRVYRYDHTNLAGGGTQMSFSGATVLTTTNNVLTMTCDGTNFYFTYQAGNSANSYVLAKYTISGTTFTYSSSITCGSADNGFPSTSGGFAVTAAGNIYTLDVGNDRITKYNSSGTQQYQDDTNSVADAILSIVNIEDTLYGLITTTPASGLLVRLNVE